MRSQRHHLRCALLCGALALACQSRPPATSALPTEQPDASAPPAFATGQKTAQDWQRMKDCAEQAERMVKQLKATERELGSSADRLMDWENHYSPKYGRCYFRASYISHDPKQGNDVGVPPLHSAIYDAFEGRVLSFCTGATAAKLAKAFCRVDDDAVPSDGDCAACQLYADEHMNK